jgi:hypothetical protein
MTDKMMTSTFSELLYQTYSSYLFRWATEIEFVLKKHKQSCGRKLPRLYPFGFILICLTVQSVLICFTYHVNVTFHDRDSREFTDAKKTYCPINYV